MYIFVEKLLSDDIAGVINTLANILNPSFSLFKGTIPVVKSSTNYLHWRRDSLWANNGQWRRLYNAEFQLPGIYI